MTLARLPPDGVLDQETIRVCVVDDQTLFREALAGIVATQPGLEVVGQAEDGEEAVRQGLSLRPDVILMDIELPGMDGLEATRRIKEACPGIRVIAVTAYPSDETFQRSMGAGVDSFVLKDAKLAELVATIRLTCRGSRLFNGTLLDTFLQNRRSSVLPWGLTQRELEVLQHLGSGSTNRVIASELQISEKTVRNHVSNIYTKLSVSGRAQAVLFGLQNGIVAGRRAFTAPAS